MNVFIVQYSETGDFTPEFFGVFSSMAIALEKCNDEIVIQYDIDPCNPTIKDQYSTKLEKVEWSSQLHNLLIGEITDGNFHEVACFEIREVKVD